MEMAESPKDDFDPYKARVVEAPVTNFGTMLHFLKGSIGTGILAMPKGFVYTGLVFGSISTFIVGALCSYGLNLLMSTEYQLCKKKRVGYLAYSDAMQYSMEMGPESTKWLAKPSGIMVNLFLISYQLGICCVYIIFVSKNVKQTVDDYFCEVMSLRAYMCIFLVLFLLITYVPNLKLFAPLSGVANFLMLVGLGIILYFVFTDFPSLEERSYVGIPSKWVMFIGITLFAIESVGVVCSAEYVMEKPQDFGGVFGILNISMVFVTLLYWFVGFFGYGKFGDKSEGTITLNLPPSSFLSETTQIFFAGALVISYGLQCFPALELIWINYMLPKLEAASKQKQMLYQYLMRTFLVIMTFILAQAFANHLANIISFIGVVCLSMLGFAFPGLMHLCLLWPTQQYGKYNWIYHKDILMIVFGIFLLISGTYISIEDIINAGPPKPGCFELKGSQNSSLIISSDSQ